MRGIEWGLRTHIGVEYRMAAWIWRLGVWGIGEQTWPRPTLLVNAQQAISNAMGVRGNRGIVSVALASNRRMYARFAARFCINQQNQL